MTDFGKSLEELRVMKWRPRYHRALTNPSAPGGEVDMWEMVNAGTGETIVSVGVPKGRSDIAGYIAACCGNPVRWVTAMDMRDPRADGIADPGNALAIEAKAIGDVLFVAYSEWLERNGQANGYTLNDALSYLWFAFCGQLDHQQRGRLLFRFLQLATKDYTPPSENAP